MGAGRGNVVLSVLLPVTVLQMTLIHVDHGARCPGPTRSMAS